MILLFELFKFVFGYMLEKKKRVFLTISGIIIGIFTFTFFIFASQGLSNAITEQFSSIGVNVLAIQPAGGSGGPNSDTSLGLTDTDVSKVKQVIRGYIYVAPFIFHQAQYEYGRDKLIITTLGYPDKYWNDVKNDLNLEIESGRFFRSGDSGSVVIGGKLAKEGFDGETELKVGNSIKYEDRNFRIIGIIKERGDLFVDKVMLMPFDNVKEISGRDTYSGIRASFYENVDPLVMKEAILKKMNPRNGEKVVEVTSPDQVIEQLNQIIGVLSLIISFVSIVALVVGGVNVMNTMYSNVLERVNEISVMKAMGATNSDIRKLFLVESSLLGVVGAIIGLLMSYFLAEGLSMIIVNFGYNVPIYFDWMFFGEVILATAVFTILCGTYPAVKAAKINPADNLRDD